MKLQFSKLSGAGNDFILLARRPAGNLSPLARRLCDRRSGIGADGLLLVERKARPKLTYLNADGSRAFCGNGTRCAAWWLKTRGWTRGKSKFMIDSNAGLIKAAVGSTSAAISLPSPKDIRLNLRLKALGKNIKVHYLLVGVPHAVVEVANTSRAPVARLGAALRAHRYFGEKGANVDFITLHKGRLRLRTFERGVEAETLACGTGAAASAVAAFLLGKARPPVFVKALGGDLRVGFSAGPAGGFDKLPRVSEVWLEGPARLVYEGTINL